MMIAPVRLTLHGAPLFCREALRDDHSVHLVGMDDEPEAILCHWRTAPPDPLPASVRIIGTNTSSLFFEPPEGIDVVRTNDLPRALMQTVCSVPEVAIGMMLELHRRLSDADGSENRDDFIAPYQLAGRKVVIEGRGRIAGQIWDVLQAFRMIRTEDYSDASLLFVACAPDRGMVVRREHLEKLPEHAVVIDISQPGVMDIEAAIEMALTGRLRGVGSDVADPETLRDRPGFSWDIANRIMITPHIGGSTADARRITELGVVREMVRRLRS